MFDQVIKVEFRGVVYDQVHGNPFDRGSADSYYGRAKIPHWYPNGTGNEPEIPSNLMTDSEIRAYYAGYEYNEQMGDKKSWD